MSTPVHDTQRTRTAVVPSPRQASDPPLETATPPPADDRQGADTYQEPVSIFGRHGWLVPAVGVACVLAVFISMVLLTWIAGGSMPFGR